MTFGHLAGALHEILTGLGGTSRVWRVDRMATAVIADTDRLNPQFAQMAKHYGVDVAICPPHRPQRKGVVEAAVKFIGGRWWRTARVTSMLEAQQSPDATTRGPPTLTNAPGLVAPATPTPPTSLAAPGAR